MKAAVIGLGTMGAGIAEVFARAGWQVLGVDNDQPALDRGRKIITASTGRAVEKGKLDASAQQELLSRLEFTTDWFDLAECQLVVEAVPEIPALKAELFRRLDAAVGPATVLASNTSSLSVTEIAEVTSRPERVLGVHFFNPAPVQRLVEVIHTRHTAPEVVDQVQTWLTPLGKTAVPCGDRAGFIVNRLLITYLNSAVNLYASGRASREQIDATLQAAGNPMGPLTLLDLIGLDVAHAVLIRIQDEEPDIIPAELLTAKVEAGELGRKTGRGFYAYDGSEVVQPTRTEDISIALPGELLQPYLDSCTAMARSGYASPEAIDTAMALGCRMPRPFADQGAVR